MRYAICNEMFENWPWERVCSFCREMGYHGIEVAPFTIAPHVAVIDADTRQQMRRVAERMDLQILGIHWLLANVISDTTLYVTHPDPQVRMNTSAYFFQLTKLCADLGGHVMVIGSPKSRNLLPGVSRDQAMDYAREVFLPCLELAAHNDITLAIEPLGPAETDFLNTAAEGIELIDRIGHPNFRLHLDVKAMSSEPTPMPQIIRNSAKHLAHFHANDPNLLGPGMGEVKFEPIIKALREVEYDGYLSVEVFDFKPGAEKIGSESIRYLKRVCGDKS
ncbi:MAG TPA: sugar phosphate isomerase/epimerase family protein [Tepidisphaeraceae bacterium]